MQNYNVTGGSSSSISSPTTGSTPTTVKSNGHTVSDLQGLSKTELREKLKGAMEVLAGLKSQLAEADSADTSKIQKHIEAQEQHIENIRGRVTAGPCGHWRADWSAKIKNAFHALGKATTLHSARGNKAVIANIGKLNEKLGVVFGDRKLEVKQLNAPTTQSLNPQEANEFFTLSEEKTDISNADKKSSLFRMDVEGNKVTFWVENKKLSLGELKVRIDDRIGRLERDLGSLEAKKNKLEEKQKELAKLGDDTASIDKEIEDCNAQIKQQKAEIKNALEAKRDLGGLTENKIKAKVIKGAKIGVAVALTPLTILYVLASSVSSVAEKALDTHNRMTILEGKGSLTVGHVLKSGRRKLQDLTGSKLSAVEQAERDKDAKRMGIKELKENLNIVFGNGEYRLKSANEKERLLDTKNSFYVVDAEGKTVSKSDIASAVLAQANMLDSKLRELAGKAATDPAAAAELPALKAKFEAAKALHAELTGHNVIESLSIADEVSLLARRVLIGGLAAAILSVPAVLSTAAHVAVTIAGKTRDDDKMKLAKNLGNSVKARLIKQQTVLSPAAESDINKLTKLSKDKLKVEFEKRNAELKVVVDKMATANFGDRIQLDNQRQLLEVRVNNAKAAITIRLAEAGFHRLLELDKLIGTAASYEKEYNKLMDELKNNPDLAQIDGKDLQTVIKDRIKYDNNVHLKKALEKGDVAAVKFIIHEGLYNGNITKADMNKFKKLLDATPEDRRDILRSMYNNSPQPSKGIIIDYMMKNGFSKDAENLIMDGLKECGWDPNNPEIGKKLLSEINPQALSHLVMAFKVATPDVLMAAFGFDSSSIGGTHDAEIIRRLENFVKLPILSGHSAVGLMAASNTSNARVWNCLAVAVQNNRNEKLPDGVTTMKQFKKQQLTTLQNLIKNPPPRPCSDDTMAAYNHQIENVLIDLVNKCPDLAYLYRSFEKDMNGQKLNNRFDFNGSIMTGARGVNNDIIRELQNLETTPFHAIDTEGKMPLEGMSYGLAQNMDANMEKKDRLNGFNAPVICFTSAYHTCHAMHSPRYGMLASSTLFGKYLGCIGAGIAGSATTAAVKAAASGPHGTMLAFFLTQAPFQLCVFGGIIAGAMSSWYSRSSLGKMLSGAQGYSTNIHQWKSRYDSEQISAGEPTGPITDINEEPVTQGAPADESKVWGQKKIKIGGKRYSIPRMPSIRPTLAFRKAQVSMCEKLYKGTDIAHDAELEPTAQNYDLRRAARNLRNAKENVFAQEINDAMVDRNPEVALQKLNELKAMFPNGGLHKGAREIILKGFAQLDRFPGTTREEMLGVLFPLLTTTNTKDDSAFHLNAIVDICIESQQGGTDVLTKHINERIRQWTKDGAPMPPPAEYAAYVKAAAKLGNTEMMNKLLGIPGGLATFSAKGGWLDSGTDNKSLLEHAAMGKGSTNEERAELASIVFTHMLQEQRQAVEFDSKAANRAWVNPFASVRHGKNLAQRLSPEMAGFIDSAFHLNQSGIGSTTHAQKMMGMQTYFHYLFGFGVLGPNKLAANLLAGEYADSIAETVAIAAGPPGSPGYYAAKGAVIFAVECGVFFYGGYASHKMGEALQHQAIRQHEAVYGSAANVSQMGESFQAMEAQNKGLAAKQKSEARINKSLADLGPAAEFVTKEMFKGLESGVALARTTQTPDQKEQLDKFEKDIGNLKNITNPAEFRRGLAKLLDRHKLDPALISILSGAVMGSITNEKTIKEIANIQATATTTSTTSTTSSTTSTPISRTGINVQNFERDYGLSYPGESDLVEDGVVDEPVNQPSVSSTPTMSRPSFLTPPSTTSGSLPAAGVTTSTSSSSNVSKFEKEQEGFVTRLREQSVADNEDELQLDLKGLKEDSEGRASPDVGDDELEDFDDLEDLEKYLEFDLGDNIQKSMEGIPGMRSFEEAARSATNK